MAEEKDPADWLFPQAAEQKQARDTKAFEWAQKYLCFAGPTADPRARDLLAYWVKEIENRDIAPAAQHSEFAYWEGRRAFVRGIQRQIELAQNTQNVPQSKAK